MMGVPQLFVSFRGALPVADLCPLFFVEVPVPQDPGLPEERNTGNSEMVALLTALSQVQPHVPLSIENLKSHILNGSDRTPVSTLLLSV